MRTAGHTATAAARGFSLIELTVAAALVTLIAASVAAQFSSVEGAFAVQTEDADMAQRLRAALDAMRRDVALAGSGPGQARDFGPLTDLAPAVLPYRIGLRGADAPGTVRSDAMTVVAAVGRPAAFARLADPLTARSDVVRVAVEPGCPVGDPVCGLTVDAQVLVADGAGAFDFFTVTSVAAPALALRHDTPDWPKVYPAGSAIVPVRTRTYFLKPATATTAPQLVRYDGGTASDVPVVDHVVSVTFRYLGEPEPPRMLRPLTSPHAPLTTYGPPPPVDPSAVPPAAGASCLYDANGTAVATPRLPSLGSGGASLVPLLPAALGDGPWCPDAGAPARYDADLLRVRGVEVSVRIESALDSLRGPAGALFVRPGSARRASRFAPDLELRARMTPPNLVSGR